MKEKSIQAFFFLVLGSKSYSRCALGSLIVLLLFLTLGFLSLCRMARACLDLMAAVVTQGPEAARDVCSCFDLNKKALYALVTKRDSKVRTPSVMVVHSSLPFERLWWWFFLPCTSKAERAPGALW